MNSMSFGMLTSKFFFAVLVLLILIMPAPVLSQSVAVGQATAAVLATLSVTATHDLAFGDVLQGVRKSADKSLDAEAGVFQIVGAGGFEITMSLTLPLFLWNNAVGNEDRLIVAFTTTGCDLDTTAAGTPSAHGPGAIVDQNPLNIPDTVIGTNDNIIQLFLGGNVYPAIDQRAGNYTADIILTVSYTGT
ncbi:MAG: hypothetical protein ABIJ45_03480 [Candidatus Zixiibacteriota bacterium]